MKFRIGLVAFIILVALIGAAVFLFLPKGGAKNGIFFNTYEGVYAKITGSVSGNANSITLSDLTYSEGAKPTASELASWQVDLEFGDSDEITITISVENKNTNSLYVMFKDDRQTINNVTKTILNDGRPYTSGSIVVLQSDTDTTLFTITFRRDQDVVTSIRYNYHIELKAELTDADIRDGSVEAEENSGYTYTFNGNGTATITGLSASNAEANLDLPNVVAHENQLYLITTIGNDAFKNKTTITSVTIPNTVTELGNGVFEGCTNLTNVTIPTSVTKLGNRVLKDCSNIITIELPNSITSIGTHLFSGCTKLTNYNIPTQITKLSTRMFENCERITEFTFPTQITTLGDYVFNGLGFETLTIPDTITTLTENSFSGITNIGELTLSCYVTSLEGANNGLFTGVTNIDRAIITANNNGTEIGAALCGASTLQEVEMSTGVTTIGSYAFSGCNNLTEVAIPDGVTSIGGNAFNSCEGVTEFTIPNTVTSIGEGAFRCCYALTNIEIPEGVESIGASAFYGCNALTKVVTPSIEDWLNILFDNSSSNPLYYAHHLYEGENEITELVIPNGTTSITNYAFYNCSNLTSVTISTSVTTIGMSVFEGCLGLTNIVIPNSVTLIVSNAFSNCTGLNSIYIPNTMIEFLAPNSTPTGILSPFFGCSSSLIVYTGVESSSSKPSGWGNNWNYYSSSSKLTVVWNTSLEDYNSILELQSNNPNFIFQGTKVIGYNGNPESITVPNGATGIGSGAFSNCTNLTSIVVPNSVSSINKGAFAGCGSLVNMTLPFVGDKSYDTSATSWEMFGYIFGSSNYAGAVSITQPLSSSTLFNSTYYVPMSLRNVIITGGSILKYMFMNCSMITNITMPEDLTSIGVSAFRYCSGLTSITIPEGVDSIGSYAFGDCSKLYIVNNLSQLNVTAGSDTYGYVGKRAHLVVSDEGYLDKLEDIGGVVYYKENADNYHAVYLSDTTKTSVIFDEKTVEICREVCYDGSLLTSVTIPSGVTSVGDKAFAGCDALENIVIQDGNTVYDSHDNCNAVIEKLTNTLIAGCKNTTIPSGVVKIEDNAFYGCTGLINIIIPDSVTMIGSYAFYGCSELMDVTIGSGVASVGERAFYGCSSLTVITIPNSVTSIGSWAFSGCSGLTTVTIDSADVYNTSTSTSAAGKLLENATTIYVLASVVEDINNTNTFLNDTNNYTKSANAIDWNGGQYYQYQKVNNG